MINKSLLVEKGFDRVSGSSVWHHGEADVYVSYIDLMIQGEALVLDGRKESDAKLISAVKSGLDASVIIEDVIIEEPVVEPIVETAPEVVEDTLDTVVSKIVD